MTAQQPQSPLFQRISFWLPILALISLVFLLWLPFGWQIGFYTDEWTTMNDIQAGAFITGSVRPFEVVSWYIAYHLTPENLYIGINVLVMLLMMGKGIVSYLLLSDLRFNKLHAFGTAALLVLYPADKGVFYLGALTIHSSILSYLLAVWLLVRFWHSGRWWLWIAISFVTGICIGLYEGIFPLIFFAPLILVYLEGRISRRVIVTSLLWMIVPCLFGLRAASILFFNSSTNSYQSSLFASDHSIGTILASIGRANQFSLIDAWISATNQMFTYGTWSELRGLLNLIVTRAYFFDILAAIAIVGITSLILIRFSQREAVSKRHLIIILLASPVILSLGFLLYSLTNLRNVNVRTLLHASLGAALFISSLLWLVGNLLRKPCLVYTIGLLFLVGLALYSLLVQHEGQVITGQFQLPFMQTLVRKVPKIMPNSMVVIVDETSERDLEHLFNISQYFDAPVKIIYSDPSLSGVICYRKGNQSWGPYEETCRFQADQFQWLLKDQPTWTSTYDHLVIFRYLVDKTLQLETDISLYTNSEQARQLYAPERLIRTDAPLPIRAETMLNMSP